MVKLKHDGSSMYYIWYSCVFLTTPHSAFFVAADHLCLNPDMNLVSRRVRVEAMHYSLAQAKWVYSGHYRHSSTCSLGHLTPDPHKNVTLTANQTSTYRQNDKTDDQLSILHI